MSRAGWLVCATVLGAIREPALAQTLQEQELEQRGLGGQPAAGGWNATLGAALITAPRFPGADSDRAGLRPLVSLDYRDTLFLGTAGLGVNLIRSGGWRAGPVIGLLPGRPQERDPHLDGLGDIATSVTAGLFARYRVGPFELGGTIRQAVTHSGNGLLGLLHVDYRVAAGNTLFAFFGPEVEFADGRYDRTWFGVTALQSADSGLPVFTPGGGVKDVGLHASLTYRASPHLFLRTFANLEQLTGDISDSPIVQRRRQGLVGAGLAYHF